MTWETGDIGGKKVPWKGLVLDDGLECCSSCVRPGDRVNGETGSDWRCSRCGYRPDCAGGAVLERRGRMYLVALPSGQAAIAWADGRALVVGPLHAVAPLWEIG